MAHLDFCLILQLGGGTTLSLSPYADTPHCFPACSLLSHAHVHRAWRRVCMPPSRSSCAHHYVCSGGTCSVSSSTCYMHRRSRTAGRSPSRSAMSHFLLCSLPRFWIEVLFLGLQACLRTFKRGKPEEACLSDGPSFRYVSRFSKAVVPPASKMSYDPAGALGTSTASSRA